MPRATTPEEFLATNWQKRPVLLAQTLNEAALPTLTPDELAWLATQPDVESRIVFTERSATNVSYRVEHGPFEEDYLGELPERDWTMLIQDVDKHLPDFTAWFTQVPFVPQWRIDDLMVSFAAPGGSVGPHKDNYDVFLCQDVGTRRWQISDDRSLPPDDNATDLALLRPFVAATTHDCSRGDALYLPPGIPHWGVATDKCITYSIGMRAPSKRELTVCTSRIYPQHADKMPHPEGACDDQFYADPDLRMEECEGLRISVRAIERLYEQGLIDSSVDPTEAAIILGSQVTDPKAWLDPDKPSGNEVSFAMAGGGILNAHGMARLAWYEDAEIVIAFVNGEARETDRTCARLLRLLCDRGSVQPEQIQELNKSQENSILLEWMLERGACDLRRERE